MSASTQSLPVFQASIAPSASPVPAQIPHRWYVAWTRSRHEKKVTAQLRERGWECFLPLVPEVHWWSDRRKIVDMPLFPGYTFLHLPVSPQARSSAVRVPGVVSLVGWNGVPVPVPDREIESVRAILARRIRLRPYQFFPAGKRVRIRGGALEGIEGIFVSSGSERSLVVSVELIQRSVAMRLDGYDVVPV